MSQPIDLTMFNEGAYQLLIRYEAARDSTVDNKVLATALGLKYKQAWDRTNKAATQLKEMGFVVQKSSRGGGGSSTLKEEKPEVDSVAEAIYANLKKKKASLRKQRAVKLVEEADIKKQLEVGEAVFSKGDDDEDSAVDAGKTKKRASPRKKRVAELQEESNIKGLLASGKAVLVKDETSDSDWDFS